MCAPSQIQPRRSRHSRATKNARLCSSDAHLKTTLPGVQQAHQAMSQLRDGDLSPWDSMLYAEAKGANLRKPKMRPDLSCNRIMRKGICNREKCRFSPCVFKSLKTQEWIEKCWK
uniref:Uncharacterized protein n=1 Tax=viral metagenome TaxID=1070528 RepID=A0A6C0IZX6_9ZZZZ